MPNKSAAKKALRKTIRQTVLNARIKTNVKALYSKAMILAKEGDVSKTREASVKFQQAVDKAVQSHVFSRGSASRDKARIMKALTVKK